MARWGIANSQCTSGRQLAIRSGASNVNVAGYPPPDGIMGSPVAAINRRLVRCRVVAWVTPLLTYRQAMETWDAIRARRNVRNYTAQAIEDADLDRIVEAGWRSPSASNRQKWDFIVVTESGTSSKALSTVWRSAGHVARSAATIVLVLPEPEDERYRLIDQYDLGQATMAMMLAATDLGIGSGHSAVGDQEACRSILCGARVTPLRLPDRPRLSG